MSEEELQPLDPRGCESSAGDPQPVEGLPNLEVQSTVDRWKAKTAIKDPGPPPRFGIRHIMGWIACGSVYFTVIRALLIVQNNSDLVTTVAWSLSGFSVSAALLGLSIVVLRRFRGTAWPIEPGHWLLVCQALHFVGTMPTTWLFFKGLVSIGSWLTASAVSYSLYIFPLFGKSVSRLWKVLFLLLLAEHAATFMLLGLRLFGDLQLLPVASMLVDTLFELFVNYEGILVGALPVIIAVIDFRRYREYTWLHWLGIAASVWDTITTISLIVYLRLMG